MEGYEMKKITILFLNLFAISLMAFPLHAWDRGACREDIDKYCKDVKVGEGRVKECLKKHIPELSDGCKTNILEAAVKKKDSKEK